MAAYHIMNNQIVIDFHGVILSFYAIIDVTVLNHLRAGVQNLSE